MIWSNARPYVSRCCRLLRLGNFGTMPRVLLLLFALCVTTMLLVARFVFHFDASDAEGDPRADFATSIVQHQKNRISELQQQVRNLEAQLADTRRLAAAANLSRAGSDFGSLESHQQVALYLQNHFEQKIQESEVVHGVALNNEYELFAFCRFTLNRIYLVEPGLGKRVVEKPIGFKKRELLEVINYGVDKLNEKRSRNAARIFSLEDFLEGIYRTEPALGTHYELLFRDAQQPTSMQYRKVVISRPFGPVQTLLIDSIKTDKKIIHIILPLKGRAEKFQVFMARYGKLCLRLDKRTELTVVYFGQENLRDIENIIAKVEKQYVGLRVQLVKMESEVFSRGRGLQAGVDSIVTGSEVDPLLFFCDVDVVFSTDFLERCRLHTEGGVKVYYPMVFSLYNPKIVYSLQDLAIPPESDQLLIAKDSGFWRDFGYGMTCQYRSDFLAIGGFDSEITGWGLEDVYLYKKYVNSQYFVVRATDPGIFHLWHDKYCDPHLPPDQYKGCMRSKAFNEASHAQLGMLAFKEELDVHKKIIKAKETIPKR